MKPRSTTYSGINAADGFVWGQSAANWFVGRNTFTNYSLEAIQFNAGPAAAAGNEFDTKVSTYSTEALDLSAVWVDYSATASPADNAYGFIGNGIIGGRHGMRGGQQGGTSARAYQVTFCGNALSLYSAFQLSDDYPGSAVSAEWVGLANIAGNTLSDGGHGVRWLDSCTNATILKNLFTNVTFRALSYDGTNGTVGNVAVVKNRLSPISDHRSPAG